MKKFDLYSWPHLDQSLASPSEQFLLHDLDKIHQKTFQMCSTLN